MMFQLIHATVCNGLLMKQVFPPNIACGLADSGDHVTNELCRRDHRINRSKARRVEESLLETAAAASNAELELQEHTSQVIPWDDRLLQS